MFGTQIQLMFGSLFLGLVKQNAMVEGMVKQSTHLKVARCRETEKGQR